MPHHPKYRDEWVKLGYPSDIGSAIAVRPPSKTYLRVYHMTTAEFALSDIGLHRLKVARFSDLNDPFELLSLNVLNLTIRRRAQNYKNELDKKIGLLCFCQDWTSPALWGHYAANHSGICLGFDLRRGLYRNVDYINERLRIPTKLFNNDLKKRLLYTKFNHWIYEKEVRVAINLRKDAFKQDRFRFYPFSRNLQLKEVILGHRCNLPVKEVRRFVRVHHPNAATFKARPAYGWFHLVPLEKTIP